MGRGEGAGGSVTGVQGADIAAAIDNMPPETKAAATRAAAAALRFTVDHAVAVLAVPLLAVAAARLRAAVESGAAAKAAAAFAAARVEADAPAAAAALALALAAALALRAWRGARSATYLVDFYCFRPPNRLQTTADEVRRGIRATGRYNQASIDFMDKVLDISGLGEATFLPEAVRDGRDKPVEVTMAGARAETEMVLFSCVDHVLQRTGLKPTDVDALIINCTSFNPVPSLSAAVVNKFKMRRDVRTFNLSGMGCAGSIIATDIARDLLAAHPNTRVLIAGTENIVWNLYFGNQRSMLITNCIFRMGGVGYLLSNRRDDARRAKYVLNHLVRTHLAGDDVAYNAVIQREDDDGIVGVKIGKELMTVAGRALEANITQLGPRVLPLSEKLLFAANFVARKVFKSGAKRYVPDFTRAFDHFCIHPGGKAVIDEVGKALKLKPHQTLPMLKPFERYGNTSSSSTWYAWSYVETTQRVRKGDRVWQLGFGSGFKCCSAVWTALRECTEAHDAWCDVESCA